MYVRATEIRMSKRNVDIIIFLRDLLPWISISPGTTASILFLVTKVRADVVYTIKVSVDLPSQPLFPRR